MALRYRFPFAGKDFGGKGGRNKALKKAGRESRALVPDSRRLLRSTRGVRHRGAGERLATRVTCPWVSILAILEISFSLADFRSCQPRELPADQYSERK